MENYSKLYLFGATHVTIVCILCIILDNCKDTFDYWNDLNLSKTILLVQFYKMIIRH